jgi:lysophospholipase L1-like esterase
MRRAVLILAFACATAAGCGGSNGPTGPTLTTPRLSRTRFLAFGDSFTAGEVTSPISSSSAGIHRLVVLPAASYPAVLQSQLQSTYQAQASSIRVINSGEPGERILDGLLRFPNALDGSGAEVVLLMEGANGLPGIGPDISADVMRAMVQRAKNARARVFVGSMIPQVAGRPRATTPTFELLNYNKTLQQMSTEEGATFVELYNAMLADAASLIGTDGLHPTEAGYRKIADLFLAAIRREFEER